jgi:hypothetical protein
MALRLSTAIRNHILNGGSLKTALKGGVLKLYTGSQPASADDAPTGTLLCTFSDAGGTPTREVRATGTVTLTGGGSGSVNDVTVDGVSIIGDVVSFDTDLSTTAAALADAINKHVSTPNYSASVSGAVVTIQAAPGSGASPNTFVVTADLTTITATYGDMASGVDAVNGLEFDAAAAGVMTKDSLQVWQGTAVGSGTAGWFRYEAAETDSGAADAAERYNRMDGAVATSGAQLNMSSTTITALAVQTLSSFQVTMPAS